MLQVKCFGCRPEQHAWNEPATPTRRWIFAHYICEFTNRDLLGHLVAYASQPRVALTVDWNYEKTNSSLSFLQFQPPNAMEISTTGKVPSVLHINRESRERALQHYQLLAINDQRKIYFNYDEDIFKLRPQDSIRECIPSLGWFQLANVQKLIIHYDDIDWWGLGRTSRKFDIVVFTNCVRLHEIYVMESETNWQQEGLQKFGDYNSEKIKSRIFASDWPREDQLLALTPAIKPLSIRHLHSWM